MCRFKCTTKYKIPKTDEEEIGTLRTEVAVLKEEMKRYRQEHHEELSQLRKSIAPREPVDILTTDLLEMLDVNGDWERVSELSEKDTEVTNATEIGCVSDEEEEETRVEESEKEKERVEEPKEKERVAFSKFKKPTRL